MKTRHISLGLILLICMSCGQPQQLGTPLTPAERDAPFPDLLPISSVLSGRSTTQRLTNATAGALADRIANLRRRAAQLQGPVVDPATRANMRAGVARAALR